MGFRDRERTSRELELIAGVGQICSELPDVSVERDGFGHTSFRVRRRRS